MAGHVCISSQDKTSAVCHSHAGMCHPVDSGSIFYGGAMNRREALEKLKRSKFRFSFHLKEKDKEYVRQKGMAEIEVHARRFVKERLAPAVIANDGRQTPMKGHPVFIAQHATACCCRGCLYKWYKVEPHMELTPLQQEKIVRLIMAWIEGEMKDESV